MTIKIGELYKDDLGRTHVVVRLVDTKSKDCFWELETVAWDNVIHSGEPRMNTFWKQNSYILEHYKLITNGNYNNTMNTIKNTIKSLLRTEPEKSFIKVGFLDESENITQKGREALEYILWENNKNELKKLADKLLDDGKDTLLA